MPRITRSYVFTTIVWIALCEVLVGIAFLFPRVSFDPKVGLSMFLGIPAFVIAITSMIRTQQIQRASYMRDFLTEFRRNNELYTAFYDLVYRYQDDIYERVQAFATRDIETKG